ncbi:MAG: hypothetical protein ACE5ID_04945 [Acidobacteriota bacterium]
MIHLHGQFLGVDVDLSADCELLSQVLKQAFPLFPRSDRALADPSFSIRFRSAKKPSLASRALSPYCVVVHETGGAKPAAGPRALGCRIYRDRGRLIFDLGSKGAFVLDCGEGTVEGEIVCPEMMATDVQGGIMHFSLTEVLKRYGIFHVHASCVARGGHAVLFPGPSGSGKTTSSQAMVRAGFGFLADDCTLVHAVAGRVEVIPLPTHPKILSRTEELLPGTARRLREKGLEKANATAFRLRLVVVPKITGESRSCMEPIPPAAALRELLPQSLLISDPAIARAQFDTLAALVASARCYRLRFGRDVEALPDLIGSALEQA